MTEIRMKKKAMNKVRLDVSGAMVIDVVRAASDAASKGVSAQPPGPMTAMETQGLPGGASVTESAASAEMGTGGPTTRIAPASIESIQATNQGAEPIPVLDDPVMENKEGLDTAAPTQNVPAAPGDPAPAAPSMEAAKDPNAQKEATTVAPNTGAGRIVGETDTK